MTDLPYRGEIPFLLLVVAVVGVGHYAVTQALARAGAPVAATPELSMSLSGMAIAVIVFGLIAAAAADRLPGGNYGR
jgi:drug/metabolite transporter (DMT)-like permease